MRFVISEGNPGIANWLECLGHPTGSLMLRWQRLERDLGPEDGPVVERVKLGVLSPRSNPLAKCDRILFVFVEQRGDDFFVAGHHAREFSFETWTQMWRDGWIVETAAGSPERPARGLYLVPRWFRTQRIWPLC